MKNHKKLEEFLKERFTDTEDDITRIFAKVRLNEFAQWLDKKEGEHDRTFCSEQVFRGENVCDGEIKYNLEGGSGKLVCPCECHKPKDIDFKDYICYPKSNGIPMQKVQEDEE